MNLPRFTAGASLYTEKTSLVLNRFMLPAKTHGKLIGPSLFHPIGYGCNQVCMDECIKGCEFYGGIGCILGCLTHCCHGIQY
jgi:hypothetical protein